MFRRARRMGNRKARQIDPNSCEGFINNKDGLINADRLRKMLAMAVKYILPQEYWDYKDPLKTRAFQGRTYEAHKDVRPMIETFRSRTAQQMKENGSKLNECLKWLVHYSDGLNNPKCKMRTRKKRISQVTREFRKRIRDLNQLNSDSTRGVVLFSLSVKWQFLGKGRS
jgi:hypothetical protein